MTDLFLIIIIVSICGIACGARYGAAQLMISTVIAICLSVAYAIDHQFPFLLTMFSIIAAVALLQILWFGTVIVVNLIEQSYGGEG